MIVLLTCVAPLLLHGQVKLKFDKRFAECEDRWVSFRMNEDSTYDFGFIYIDPEAGFTFHREGHFSIIDQKISKVQKPKDYNIKVRLEPNDTRVALIPQTMFTDLQLSPFPDWMKYYKTDTSSAKHFYNWGYKYNEWNECEKALVFLLRAKDIEPDLTDLNTELAFTYNCLKKYDQAEAILEKEVMLHPTPYCVKEYIYTCIQSKHIEKAIAKYESSLKPGKSDPYRAENCFNILGHYFKLNDRKNFDVWYTKLSECSHDQPAIAKLALQLKESFDKK